jgi:sulfur-oxidizing protein SoxY
MCATFLASTAFAEEIRNPLEDGETWSDLRFDVAGEAEIAGGEALFFVDAPYRAHDAATVPVHIRQLDGTDPILAATVVIDENPAPVAGEFTFSDAMMPLDFEMRVRVDQYSNVRVLAETKDGLAMNGRYVKASGGCSAPAAKDAAIALAEMGKMRMRMFGEDVQMSTARREMQIMVRHPNYSGLQKDQITQLFIPSHFIDTLEVYQGEEMLFSMTGGISISENPAFRFQFNDNGASHITVRATDTEGNAFEQRFAKTAEG